MVSDEEKLLARQLMKLLNFQNFSLHAITWTVQKREEKQFPGAKSIVKEFRLKFSFSRFEYSSRKVTALRRVDNNSL